MDCLADRQGTCSAAHKQYSHTQTAFLFPLKRKVKMTVPSRPSRDMQRRLLCKGGGVYKPDALQPGYTCASLDHIPNMLLVLADAEGGWEGRKAVS